MPRNLLAHLHAPQQPQLELFNYSIVCVPMYAKGSGIDPLLKSRHLRYDRWRFRLTYNLTDLNNRQ